MSLSEHLSVDRRAPAGLGHNGKNYARVVNFYLPAGLLGGNACFGVPVAFPFLQALFVVPHDPFLAETRSVFARHQSGGPPKRASVSCVSQVDWNSIKDKSISTLPQLRARSSVVITVPFPCFGYAPGRFAAAPFLEYLPEKLSKTPLVGGFRPKKIFVFANVAQTESPGGFLCLWIRNYALRKGAKV